MSGDWHFGLLGCFGNIGICIQSFFCPCILHGKNAEAAIDASCCIQTCCFFIPVCNCCQLMKVREAVRETQGIDGGCCMDAFYSILCLPCSLAQEAQELELIAATRGQSMGRN
eukprot:GHVU01109275.1.p1 GENE.GHVU01109275.1~~GHVU01109275.1.p1  ORF type:complete len:113 (+),score=10.37 GHVU01109275.1:146-484(+)